MENLTGAQIRRDADALRRASIVVTDSQLDWDALMESPLESNDEASQVGESGEPQQGNLNRADIRGLF